MKEAVLSLSLLPYLLSGQQCKLSPHERICKLYNLLHYATSILSEEERLSSDRIAITEILTRSLSLTLSQIFICYSFKSLLTTNKIC